MSTLEFSQLLGNYGEFFGAILLFGTLIYLAIQVRHSRQATEANTRQMRGEAFVRLAEILRDQAAWLRSNPEMFEVITRSQEDWGSLSQEEARLAMMWNLDEATYHELAFIWWKEGALDEQSYLSREDYFLTLLLSPGRRYWWDNLLYLIDPRFIDRANSKRLIN